MCAWCSPGCAYRIRSFFLLLRLLFFVVVVFDWGKSLAKMGTIASGRMFEYHEFISFRSPFILFLFFFLLLLSLVVRWILILFLVRGSCVLRARPYCWILLYCCAIATRPCNSHKELVFISHRIRVSHILQLFAVAVRDTQHINRIEFNLFSISFCITSTHSYW